jgi:hypothetical protein
MPAAAALYAARSIERRLTSDAATAPQKPDDNKYIGKYA